MNLREEKSFLELQVVEIPDFARTQTALPVAPEYLPGVIEMLHGLHRHIHLVIDAMKTQAPAAPARAFEP